MSLRYRGNLIMQITHVKHTYCPDEIINVAFVFIGINELHPVGCLRRSLQQ